MTISFERPLQSDDFNGKVELKWNDIFTATANSYHARQTSLVALQVAPGRKIVSLMDGILYNLGTTVNDVNINEFFTTTIIPWIKIAKPDVAFRSMDTDNDPNMIDSLLQDVSDICTFCNAAGNYADMSYSTEINSKTFLGIGSARYNESNNTFIPNEDSSNSDDVDFVGISPIYIPKLYGGTEIFWGTSCAAPFIASQMALVNHFFIANIGRSLSSSEMYNFVKSHSQDIYNNGKDSKSGYGVFILPDPATINPYEWVDTMKIEMTVNSTTMYVDGISKTLDQAPKIDPVTNRTLIPVRAPFEAAGFKVDWDATTQKITITK